MAQTCPSLTLMSSILDLSNVSYVCPTLPSSLPFIAPTTFPINFASNAMIVYPIVEHNIAPFVASLQILPV